MTDNQKKLLSFIANYRTEHGNSPSLREMWEGIGVSGISAISGMIDSLMKKKFLSSSEGKNRSVVLTALGMQEVAKNEIKIGTVLSAIAGSSKKPVKIGDLEIECYVLEDGTRVLSERGILKGLGMSAGGRDIDEKIPRFLRGKNILPFISDEVKEQLLNPLWFKTAEGGGKRKGFKATILPEICDVWLKARDANILVRNQIDTAKMADILIRGLSRIGIIALVDEATGYQKQKDEYQKTIALYIAEEIRPWLKTFKDDYYEQLYKLLGWDWEAFKSGKKNHPQVLGKITNELVYYKLPNGVIQELEKLNPKNEKGTRKVRHHQFLTESVGYRHLIEHLAQITIIAKMYGRGQYHQAKNHIDSILPDQRQGAQMALTMPINIDEYMGNKVQEA